MRWSGNGLQPIADAMSLVIVRMSADANRRSTSTQTLQPVWKRIAFCFMVFLFGNYLSLRMITPGSERLPEATL